MKTSQGRNVRGMKIIPGQQTVNTVTLYDMFAFFQTIQEAIPCSGFPGSQFLLPLDRPEGRLCLLLRDNAFESLGSWRCFQGHTGFDDKEAHPSFKNQKALVKVDHIPRPDPKTVTPFKLLVFPLFSGAVKHKTMCTDVFPWGFVSGRAKGTLYVKFPNCPLGPAFLGFCGEAACGRGWHWAAPPDQGAVYARVPSPRDTNLPSSSKVPEPLKTREARPFFDTSIFKAKFLHCF